MPFKSKAQMRAAFAGGLGPDMKARAKTWADETPNRRSLPQHVSDHDSDDDESADVVKKAFSNLRKRRS